MIVVSLHCQMGNQLFQYAFAKVTAKRLNTFFLPFINSPYHPFKLQYFELDWFTHVVYGNKYIAHQFKRICRKLIKYVCKDKITCDDWKSEVVTKNNVFYEGFFQSEDYFQGLETQIKKLFSIRKKYINEFDLKYGAFICENKIIVIHVRRKDYDEVEIESLGGPGVSLPLAYYYKAIDEIEKKNEYQILFIGDDVDSIKADFGEKPNYHYEVNSAIVDFQLIQHADIAIIANSTFAWWAAYLSQKTNSRIIAPCYWLGFKVKKEFPAGIQTNKFEWIEF